MAREVRAAGRQLLREAQALSVTHNNILTVSLPEMLSVRLSWPEKYELQDGNYYAKRKR